MAFRDRAAAGRELASRLGAYAGRRDVVVVALPRGGVPVGAEVARALAVPLDVLVVEKIRAPAEPDGVLGAVATGGVRVADRDLARALDLTDETVEQAFRDAEARVAARERVYRAGRPPLALAGRTVLLLDDGIATGATIRAAVAAVERMGPARLVVAVPVGSYAACVELARRADESICLYVRDPVYAVRLWYDQMPTITDDEVLRLLESARGADVAASPPGAGH
jgi:putative phosphoribosyl transferase